MQTRDHQGNPVQLGTRVRVLKIAEFLMRDLPIEARERLGTMIGEVFEVNEIDEHGFAWVAKWWDAGEHNLGHSLSLGPDEMEVVSEPNNLKTGPSKI